MRVAITGASGLIGTALVAALRDRGDDVRRLVRHEARADDEVAWNPLAGHVDLTALEGIDGLVNLAGPGIADRRLTDKRKQLVREARVKGTGAVARAMAALPTKPTVLVSGAAVGYYADTDGRTVDESGPRGTGFIPDLVRDWEAATAPADAAGIRVATIRTGLVVSGRGGAWGKMIPLFRLGGGGRLGSGEQYWPFISLTDEVRAILRILDDDTLSGPVNLTGPEPITNAEITRIMGEVLHRPTFVPAPAAAIRVALGEFADDVLASRRVLPAKLMVAGFSWEHPTFEQALQAALAERSGSGSGSGAGSSS